MADSSYACTPLVTGLTAGRRWELADFGPYQVFANGAIVVYRDTTTGNYGQEASMTHNIESLCAYNGQLVAGGLGSGYQNFVAWSDIGSATLTSLMTPDIKNVRGFMPMDSRGSVLKVKKLGKGVMVYSTDGISYIYPAGTTFGKENIAGMEYLGKAL
jgi:hypothetical protein